MDASVNSFTDAPERKVADEVPPQTAIGTTCQWEGRDDTELAVYCFESVTLAFDRPQAVFHLPQWRWPLIGPYNGFSGAARIRGWQLTTFYRAKAWLTYGNSCTATGVVGDTQFHNEDYARPWNGYPVSKRTHRLIHIRARCRLAWTNFLANEALPNTWAESLTLDRGIAADVRDCTVGMLLGNAPHPEWIVVPEKEFHAGQSLHPQPRGRSQGAGLPMHSPTKRTDYKISCAHEWRHDDA